LSYFKNCIFNEVSRISVSIKIAFYIHNLNFLYFLLDNVTVNYDCVIFLFCSFSNGNV